jgi:diacylglycerol kinase family enzyme
MAVTRAVAEVSTVAICACSAAVTLLPPEVTADASASTFFCRAVVAVHTPPAHAICSAVGALPVVNADETVLLDHGLDLEQLARDAIAAGADCLGMAGGDGSQALVASIAIEHDIPFVCVTAGTRNHFALDLGLDRDDPRGSMDAFHDAVERRIDYATVGDRLFVNNVSLGVYATIVQQDSYREAKRETSMALLQEMLGSTAEPFDLQFATPDGTEVDGAFLIMVSNNPMCWARRSMSHSAAACRRAPSASLR